MKQLKVEDCKIRNKIDSLKGGRMHTKTSIINELRKGGVDPKGALLVHSSMKAIGEVEGGADTVVDALVEYMKEGLLIFPTHTWSESNNKEGIYDPITEPSCVGILTNIFRKRRGVVRSLHPTHSVAAIGRGAKKFIEGEENRTTPCPRDGVLGRLYDIKAQILFLGCELTRNTYIHGVEEWNDVPRRLAVEYSPLRVRVEGRLIDTPIKRHKSPNGSIHLNYDKLEAPFLYKGAIKKFTIGDAVCYLGDAVKMADITTELLKKNPDLFIDREPVPEKWYR